MASKLPAHKIILAAGSEVFKAMFFGSFVSEYNEIEIPDIEPAAFVIEPETVIDTLYAARKYDLPALENHCVEFLEKNIANDNAFLLITQSRLYEKPNLEQICIDFLKKNVEMDNAISWLMEARFYELPDLEQKCVDFLKNNVASDNAFSWLKEARFYELPDLEQKCVDFLKNNVASDNAFSWLKEARFLNLPELEHKCVDFLKNNVDSEHAFVWLKEARFFDLPELEQKCVDFLKKSVAGNNAFLWLKQAQFYNLPELAASCLDMIDKNTAEALDATEFTQIDLDTLILILERDTLQVFESKLFQAIVTWSEAECVRKQFLLAPRNQRSVLGRALSLVRYSLMTIKEFKKGPIHSGLLDYAEVKKWKKEILSNTNSTERLRCSKNNFESYLKFDIELTPMSIEPGWFLHRFKARKNIFIVGFIVLNISKNKSNVKLVLWNKNTPECIFNQTKNLSPSPDTLTFLLNKPITLSKDNCDWYYVRVNFDELADDRQMPNWRPLSCGVIDQRGQKLKDISDYFEWCPHKENSNVISEIIFYE
ncbi:uncharacterized protein LOC123292958 [Chrysoperla carnea]|uniref:uncharacterized protein LOC123292958 n=1 Tax=Chrysoperla carnea TaxID=189513 RepID=UPI001D095A96|nr:uncharacterized protein LOC123292958 [Chrysoperla carnea]